MNGPTGMPFAAVVAEVEQLGASPAAVERYQAWLAANPGAPHAFAGWFNLGATLSSLGEREAAVAAYRNAVALHPAFHPASVNLGLQLEALGRTEDALAAWSSALQSNEARTTLLNQRARLLEHAGRLDEAEQLLRTSLLTDPAQPDAVQHWVHLRQRMCLWPLLDPLPGLPADTLQEGAGPLGILALTDDVAVQRRVAASWIGRKTSPAPTRLSPAGGYAHSRVRIGYLSSDFCNHALSHLVAELFERHDRTRFEVYGYSAGADDGSALRRRVLGAFDHVRDVRMLDDAAAATRIRADEIDVLIDLNGLTAGSRLAVLRWRPAPVQATWLGYIGPVPLPELDYLLCDAHVVPASAAPAYAPVPLAVGPVYQANDGLRGSAPIPTRATLGLPPQGFVYCCFANHYKIGPDLFQAWMQVLLQVPDAVLWLAEDNRWSKANLVHAATQAGIDSRRLVFADRCGPDAYMARLAVADLYLDTTPYNAGTVASDAMRMGLPLLTCSGRSFASRMAGSLLTRMGAAGCITETLDAYVAQAIAWGRDPEAHRALRQAFGDAPWRRALGDTATFAHDFEAAITAIVARPTPALAA